AQDPRPRATGLALLDRRRGLAQGLQQQPHRLRHQAADGRAGPACAAQVSRDQARLLRRDVLPRPQPAREGQARDRRQRPHRRRRRGGDLAEERPGSAEEGAGHRAEDRIPEQIGDPMFENSLIALDKKRNSRGVRWFLLITALTLNAVALASLLFAEY